MNEINHLIFFVLCKIIMCHGIVVIVDILHVKRIALNNL
jgi:hypothetical protein